MYIVMDIGKGSGGVSGRLSNFTPRRFVFDEVECYSIEGVLQSFKFKNPEMQKEVCKLVGSAAKFKGKKKNWRESQILYWQGKEYKRDSAEYQDLLNRLYQSVYDQNEGFRKDLNSCRGVTFTHSLGKHKKSETVLTSQEFCSRLTKLRDTGKLVYN